MFCEPGINLSNRLVNARAVWLAKLTPPEMSDAHSAELALQLALHLFVAQPRRTNDGNSLSVHYSGPCVARLRRWILSDLMKILVGVLTKLTLFAPVSFTSASWAF